ncbi:hypothetical protein CMI47_18635 [Candidatus Pacearchaeota archaeon]|nr:hypothetical protein [Candidatus Pacearchaeota archaeon]|tara:strand:+ start:15289 stop:15522 length:234 start_codon:yes stop_codon:yes gene_type:complete
MQTKFKRHDPVKLTLDPDQEYVEYSVDYVESAPPIKKGMTGEINTLLPNGQYHVLIKDPKGKDMAYVTMAEEYLEAI